MYPVPLAYFGPGCLDDFAHYLRGGTVELANVEKMAGWLKDCRYVHDEQHLGAQDVWQHPDEFEHTRRGDCEDHALWAWNALKRLGLDAEFVVGTMTEEGRRTRHAWVHFSRNEERCLLEPTAKRDGQMIFSFAQARSIYRPEVGVDHQLKMYVYEGSMGAVKAYG